MAEQLPPYNLQYPDGFDDPADFPTLLQQNLQALSSMVVGQFDTQASAQAALGSSSQSPVFYTTKSPTTLWCLDASGANQVWSLGSQFTTGTFTLAGSDGNAFALGSSIRSLRYRVEGSHVYGSGALVVGTGVAWPSGLQLWFPLPFAPTNSVTGVKYSIGSFMATPGGSNIAGTVFVSAGVGHCVLYGQDAAKSSSTPARALDYSSGNSGTALSWTSGDTISYNFDYERAV